MKIPTLTLVIGIALGFATGWTVKEKSPNQTEISPQITMSERKKQRSMRSIPTTLSQVDLQSADDLKSSIKTENIRTLLEHLLERAKLSGLKKDDRKIYEDFLFEWAEREPEAARMWAEGQEGQPRELALMTLTTFHAKDDPETALDLLKQVGWIDLRYNWGDFTTVLKFATERALADGPEALVKLQKSLPRGHNTGSHSVGLEYLEETNFAALLDALDEISPPLDLPWDSKWEYPLRFVSPMKTWISRDPEAAWNYLRNLVESNLDFTIRDFVEDVEGAELNAPNWAWVADRVVQMTNDEQIALVSGSAARGGSLLRDFPPAVNDPAEKQRYLTNYLQANLEAHGIDTAYSILHPIPPEERVDIVSGLRNIDEAGINKIRTIMSQMDTPAKDSNRSEFRLEAFGGEVKAK